MGTSASYTGPAGENPLLPPWAPPAEDHDSVVDEIPSSTTPSEISPEQEPGLQEQDVPQPQMPGLIPWSIPKSSLSRFTSSLNQDRDGRGHLTSAMRDFVRAQGGARRASRAARAGRAATQRLGGFLTSVVNEGVTAAVDSLGLREFIGQDVNTVLAALVDRIAPTGAFLEGAVARTAIIQTLDELFQEYAVAENGLDALNALDVEGVKHTFQQCVANYIYTRLVQVISQRIESRTTDDLIQVEMAVKDYVFSTVRLDLMSKMDVLSINWNGPEGQDFTERIYQEGYELIEKIL